MMMISHCHLAVDWMDVASLLGVYCLTTAMSLEASTGLVKTSFIPTPVHTWRSESSTLAVTATMGMSLLKWRMFTVASSPFITGICNNATRKQ